MNRASGCWVPYQEYPRFLNWFEYFLDFKGLEESSENALEDLVCGLKVVHVTREGVITFDSKLPEANRFANVLTRSSTIAGKLL